MSIYLLYLRPKCARTRGKIKLIVTKDVISVFFSPFNVFVRTIFMLRVLFWSSKIKYEKRRVDKQVCNLIIQMSLLCTTRRQWLRQAAACWWAWHFILLYDTCTRRLSSAIMTWHDVFTFAENDICMYGMYWNLQWNNMVNMVKWKWKKKHRELLYGSECQGEKFFFPINELLFILLSSWCSSTSSFVCIRDRIHWPYSLLLPYRCGRFFFVFPLCHWLWLFGLSSHWVWDNFI